MSYEAELFVIRCSINQATHLSNTNWIIVIMDSIHAAKKIFNSSLHPYQIHSSAISCELRDSFEQNSNNSIEFWDCPSSCKWSLHNIVDKETKKLDLTPIFPCKSSWDFSRKNECNNILNSWKMHFQALDDKGQHFLELLDDDSKPIEPLISKGGTWLKYCLRFFPWKEFKCPCGLYPIESRWHILHECRRYDNYWNPRRDSIVHLTLFLEFNSSQTVNSFFWFQSLFIFFLSPSFSSFSFCFIFCSSCSVHPNVYSYEVATMDYLRAPCNKLLIFKKKQGIDGITSKACGLEISPTSFDLRKLLSKRCLMTHVSTFLCVPSERNCVTWQMLILVMCWYQHLVFAATKYQFRSFPKSWRRLSLVVG